MDSNTAAVAATALLLLIGGGIFFAGVSGDEVDYEARIAALEAETQLLQERVDTLEKRRGRRDRGKARGGDERRGGRDGGRGGGPSEWDSGRSRGGGDGERVDIAAALESSDPEVRAKVQDLVREEMEAADEERWQKRRERRAQRIEAAIEGFVAAQGLSAADQERLSALWSDERESISELFIKAREDMSWGKAREEAERVREETDESAKAMLSEEDYAAWVQLREEENPRRR